MVGQSDASNWWASPGNDGSGSGVPQSNVVQNVTNLANAVAQDVAGVYRTVNSPPPPQAYNYAAPQQQGVAFGFGLIPLLLLIGAGILIFKAVD